jgi:hypothetical protein
METSVRYAITHLNTIHLARHLEHIRYLVLGIGLVFLQSNRFGGVVRPPPDGDTMNRNSKNDCQGTIRLNTIRDRRHTHEHKHRQRA